MLQEGKMLPLYPNPVETNKEGKWTQMWIIERSKWEGNGHTKMRKIKVFMDGSEKRHNYSNIMVIL